MWRVAAFVLACAACGRIGFAPEADAVAVEADAVAVEADAACAFGAFSPPARVGVVNSATDDDWAPSLTADGLALYFYSLRASAPGQPDLWRANRPDEGSPFGAPVVVTEVSSPDQDSYPVISADDLTLVFSSGRPGGQDGHDLWITTRPDRDATFSSPVVVPELSSSFVDIPGWLGPDGLSIVFSSNRGTSFDLYRAGRPSVGAPFVGIALISEVNSPAAEMTPALSADGLVLVFSSERPGGLGGVDLWITQRTTIDGVFDPPTNLMEVNSPLDEFGPALSADGSSLYFAYQASIAGENNIDADIWVATRARVCP